MPTSWRKSRTKCAWMLSTSSTDRRRTHIYKVDGRQRLAGEVGARGAKTLGHINQLVEKLRHRFAVEREKTTRLELDTKYLVQPMQLARKAPVVHTVDAGLVTLHDQMHIRVWQRGLLLCRQTTQVPAHMPIVLD